MHPESVGFWILLSRRIEQLRGGEGVGGQSPLLLDALEEGGLQVFEQHDQGGLRRPVLDVVPVAY